MIQVNNLEIHFGARTLFDGVSFQINEGDRIGLAGRNGMGKSTLLKVISGNWKEKSNAISGQKGVSIGYLPQHLERDSKKSLREKVEEGKKELQDLNAELADIEKEMNTRTDYESDSFQELLVRLSEIHEKLAVLDDGKGEGQIQEILLGLGFTVDQFDEPLDILSGGWYMRAELGKLLYQNPDLLLLDEPTNHLDIEAIQWLEGFLKKSDKTIILISHDRQLLDNLTNRTIEIVHGKIYDYPCNYTTYLERRTEELEIQKNAAKNQEKYIEKTEQLINKFRAKSSKAKMAQSLIKKLDKLDRIEVVEDNVKTVAITFPFIRESGKVVLTAKHLEIGYGKDPIIKDAEFIISKGDRIALLGKNGIGKSTLLKAIHGDLQNKGELIFGHEVYTGYFAQDEPDKLDPKLTVYETIANNVKVESETQIRSFLGAFLFGKDELDKKVSVLSGGEKTRLAICKMMFSPINFLIMDEPTNHLDIQTKEILKGALEKFPGTILLVSHDRSFLNGLTNKLYEVKDKRIAEHHFSVEEFLELKWGNDDSSAKPVKQEKKKDTSDNKENYERKKELEKSVRKLEKDIHNLEQEIEQMKAEMAEGGASEDEYISFGKKEKQLEQLMEQWELDADELQTMQ